MRGDEFLEKLENVDPELVEKAARPKKRRRWLGAVAALLALAILGGVLLRPDGGALTTEAFAALAEAEYPEWPPYPDMMDYVNPDGSMQDDEFNAALDAWWDFYRAQRDMGEGFETALDSFCGKTLPQFLGGADGENSVYSPLNVYLALGMLAELTDGDSRAQVLALLGSSDIGELRNTSSALWNANYMDDGASASILASSLWLDNDVSFKQKTLDTLANIYYASAYRGEMGSDEVNEALQNWLNEQTGGLLKEQADGIELDADTILALATTVYFRAKWTSEFSIDNTEPGVFRSPDGDIDCDFMHQSGQGYYYWGERFSAIERNLENGGAMRFILPDEGFSPDDLLSDSEALSFIISGGSDWESSKFLIINQAIPKFDVVSDFDLRAGLRSLGVTDVFDGSVSDFSPMTDDMDGIFVSQAKHAARVAIDEEGVTAAAYTVMVAAGGGEPPSDEVDFVLDRPFIFVITGSAGTPLFAGVVNVPA